MTWKNITWELIRPIAQVCPTSWLQSRLHRRGQIGHFASLGLMNRDVAIRDGVASGLKFNAGTYNLDTVLGTYEMPVQDILSQYLKPGDSFYDIGANVGFFTIVAAKLVGASGQVYAFEPETANVAILRRNAELNQFANVTVIEKAVSRTTGTEELCLTGCIGGHTLASVGQTFDVEKRITVNTVSIDDLLLQQKAIKPPSLVKIDVEGAEIDVLHGMSQTIQQYQPIILYEVDDEKKDNLLKKQQEINAFLLSYQYNIKSLGQAYPGTSWNVGHAIAIPQSL